MLGLFDFATDIGKKLFSSSDDAADKIKAHIQGEGLKIADLDVAYSDGIVTLSGSASNAADKEKAILLAGNVKEVKEVKADDLKSPAQDMKVEFYVIKSGDTLSKLAKKYYGNAMDYPKIFEANREVIKDPDLIYVGQKIRIPM